MNPLRINNLFDFHPNGDGVPNLLRSKKTTVSGKRLSVG